MTSGNNHFKGKLLIGLKRHLKTLRPIYNLFKNKWYQLRYQKILTKLLGYKYKPNHNNIQIALTFDCNLKCINCDMSAGLASSRDYMSIQQIGKFVEESIEKKRKWNIIAILGGEPALHARIFEVVDLIFNYKKKYSPNTRIQFFSNGFGTKVVNVLKKLPNEIEIINSNKVSPIQSNFTFFNMAPIDSEICRGVDYGNACSFVEVCGIGLTKYGYYSCIVSGGIDRVFGFDIGRKTLPSVDDMMVDQSKLLCKYCGHFMTKLSCFSVNDKLKIEKMVSRSWREVYDMYGKMNPPLSDY